MNILHITDTHGTVKSPESRTDLFYLTFYHKLAEIGYIVKMNKIDMVIHTGDLFHYSRVSNKFMGQTAEIIKTWNVPTYIVPGNHDIDGYSIDTIDQTSLGVLAKTGVINLLTRDTPIGITATATNGKKFTVAISGQEYYPQIDSGNMDDFDMQQPEKDINILAIHSYIADTPQHPNIRCVYPKDIITNADIVLTGHYHRQFAISSGDTDYYNPGSGMRVEMTEYNKTHMPCYGILNLDLDDQDYVVYDYTFHPFRIAKPSNEVFDFTNTKAIKTHSITLENFKTSIANTMQSINTPVTNNALQMITTMLSDYTIAQGYDSYKSQHLNNLSLSYYNNASNKIANEDAVITQGFVPSNTPIKIQFIDIENFQSHEKTHIDFVDGLNAIIGETNKGKTSIFRAIKWVIDNEPLGTDFIMQGKNDCTVRITYSNGAYIERHRTLKDTGYYKVWDGDSNHLEQEYRGFTNSIPVEVANIHQMPKVRLTKNLETHLNFLGQLESPFLITESTNEKAAAIGKITGTDIIDTAIKDISEEIRFNNKNLTDTIKNKNVLIESEKNFDMIALNTQKQFYIDTKKSIIDLSSLCKNALATYNDNNINEKLIADCNVEISRYQAEIADKIFVDKAEQLNLETHMLINLLSSYNKNEENIQKQNDIIMKCTDIINEKSIIEASSDKIGALQSLLTLNKNREKVLFDISKLQNDINNASNEKIEFETFIKKEETVLMLKQLLNLYTSLNLVNTKIQESNDFSNNSLSLIAGINSELDEVQENLDTFIMDSGVCPCCGQKITSKNISNIINSFSKEDK